MNGFTNGIMSILLGWLRVFINNLWRLVTSPDGSLLYRFLRDNWIAILAVLLLGGLVVDRVVYFLRWRPDYVWASRRAARRGKRKSRDDSTNAAESLPERDDADDTDDGYNSYAPANAGFAPAASAPSATRSYAPANAGFAPAASVPNATQAYAPANAGFAPMASVPNATQAYAPANAGFAPMASAPNATQAYAPANAVAGTPAAAGAARGVFAPPARAAVSGEAANSRISVHKQNLQPIYAARGSASAPGSFAHATARFAPLASVSRAPRAPIGDIVPPSEISEPIFDDDPPAWAYSAGEAGGEGRMSADPSRGMINSFGNAMPEPAEYLRDMRAGFAPQLAPERIYPSGTAPRVEDAARQQVHPGLGSDAFRQSFGLDNAELQPTSRPRPAVPETPPEFKPYAQVLDDKRQSSGKRANPFTALAKRARDLVGVEDDAHKLTIHDLQPTVDMRTAFREPVYPRPKPGDSDD